MYGRDFICDNIHTEVELRQGHYIMAMVIRYFGKKISSKPRPNLQEQIPSEWQELSDAQVVKSYYTSLDRGQFPLLKLI